MLKVGIYCRLSIEDKNKTQNNDSQSIQNQKSMLTAYCQEHNWEIYDIYCDDGYSGTDSTRPDFNRLIHDCENGHIDIVLCKDQSRFSRDIMVIENYINDRFLEWGVRFIGVADNADSESEIYSTMRLFTSAYNEMYVRDISTKIRRTLAFKREHGQFVGAFAPYGYKTDPFDKHHLVIDNEVSDNIRLIFDMYIQGNSYRKIVQELNDRNIPNPSAYKRLTGSEYVNCKAGTDGLWTQSTISSILRNETYTGTLVQGKSHHISYKNKKRKKVDKNDWIRIPDSHEAIIDSDTWQRTQERLNSRTRSERNSHELPALSGKVRCSVCGHPMKRNVYYNKSRTIKYYGLQCADYKTGTMKCPNSKTISGKFLETEIIYKLNNIIEDYCQKNSIIITDFITEKISQLERQTEKLKIQLKTVDTRLINTYMDKLDGFISENEYHMFHDALLSEKNDITVNIDILTDKIQKLSAQKTDTYEIIEKYTHLTELDRIITEEFIDYIEIGMVNEDNDREIHIHWKI